MFYPLLFAIRAIRVRATVKVVTLLESFTANCFHGEDEVTALTKLGAARDVSVQALTDLLAKGESYAISVRIEALTLSVARLEG